MKYLIATVLFVLASTANAQHRHHGHYRPHHHHGAHWNWVAPVIVGGVIGYEISRNSQPVVIQQNCSQWIQIQNPDGSITTSRTCVGP